MSMPWGTGETVALTIGATTYNGERWEFPPYMPWSGDMSVEADAYRARNASKLFECDFFGGIEYARAARWKPPVLHNPGAVTIEAKEFKVVPYQTTAVEQQTNGRPATGLENGTYTWSGYPVVEGEDCQRVHIWRPRGTPPVGGWPALIWMHGGGNDQNSAANYQTWGNWFAARGVMVFQVDYRLGLFGYFHHPDIEAEPDWQGPHFAIMDRLRALEWVNTHAADLGVDTTKVCIGGSSAGGQGALAILSMREADSWYTSAWVSSGGGFSHVWRKGPSWQNEGYAELSDRKCRAFAATQALRGVSGALISDTATASGWPAALRDIPPQAIADMQAIGFDGRNNFIWIDEADFPDRNPYQAAKNGNFNNVPVVFSHAGNEANVLGISQTTDVLNINESGFARIAGQNWAELSQGDPWNTWDAAEQARMLHGTVVFWGPNYGMAYELTDQGRDAWLRLWNYKSPGNGGDYAGHSSDVSYIFGHPTWQVAVSGSEAKLYEADLQVSHAEQTSMINTIANGDPSTPYAGAVGLGLWDIPVAWSWTKFSTVNRNTNVTGTASRVANDATVSHTNNDLYFAGVLEAFRTTAK